MRGQSKDLQYLQYVLKPKELICIRNEWITYCFYLEKEEVLNEVTLILLAIKELFQATAQVWLFLRPCMPY